MTKFLCREIRFLLAQILSACLASTVDSISKKKCYIFKITFNATPTSTHNLYKDAYPPVIMQEHVMTIFKEDLKTFYILKEM